MKNKGLGAGLGALFGEAAANEEHNDFEYMAIQRIEPRPEQPRSVFEQEKIDELTASIREHGVLQPLTVRAVGDGFYQIVAGERRWRAARAAGLNQVPIRVVAADDKKATVIALVENLQREDLNPIEEARGYRTLIGESGMTQEDVAQSVGKSRPAVANALRLLALPDGIIELVESGKLPAGSGRALLALKTEEMMFSAAQAVIKNDMNVREVESLVKGINREKQERKKTDDDEVDYIKEVKKQLEAALGRRVTIKYGKDKGRIELEYYGQDDFDVLLNELSSIGNDRRKNQ